MPSVAEAHLDLLLDRWVDALSSKVDNLHAPHRTDVERGLSCFGKERQVPGLPQPSSLAVVDEILGTEAELPSDLRKLFVELVWEPTFRAQDGGHDYALAVLTDLLGLASTQAGIMLVGSGRQYPVHQHPPPEIYLVLHGTGRWRSGGSDDYIPIEPGEIVVNRPGDVHSVIAEDGPVAALYVLWTEKSQREQTSNLHRP